MAATVSLAVGTRTGPQVPGANRRSVAVVSFDNSYPTGGYALTPAQFGLTNIDAVLFEATDVGRTAVWDRTNNKIKVFSAASTEIANATDLSADKVVVEVLGQ